MLSISNKLANLVAVIPVIVFMTLANIVIATVMAFVVFVQLLTVVGWSKNVSMVVAILVAIATHVYIRVQPYLHNYIKARSLSK